MLCTMENFKMLQLELIDETGVEYKINVTEEDYARAATGIYIS